MHITHRAGRACHHAHQQAALQVDPLDSPGMSRDLKPAINNLEFVASSFKGGQNYVGAAPQKDWGCAPTLHAAARHSKARGISCPPRRRLWPGGGGGARKHRERLAPAVIPAGTAAPAGDRRDHSRMMVVAYRQKGRVDNQTPLLRPWCPAPELHALMLSNKPHVCKGPSTNCVSIHDRCRLISFAPQ